MDLKEKKYVDVVKCSEKLNIPLCDLVDVFAEIPRADVEKVQHGEWIYDRLPTVEENEHGIVGVVNGHDGNVRFKNAIIFVDYDFNKKEWRSEEYNLINCKVKCWLPIPAYHPTEKGGAK